MSSYTIIDSQLYFYSYISDSSNELIKLSDLNIQYVDKNEFVYILNQLRNYGLIILSYDLNANIWLDYSDCYIKKTFLTVKGKIIYIFKIVKTPDDWYYVSYNSNDNSDVYSKDIAFKCDQLEGVIECIKDCCLV